MKIMGIDYGDARTGVSISDPTGFLAGSPQVIATWNTEKLLEELTALIQREKIEEIVMGLPKNMNATQGERAEKCKALGAELERRTGILCFGWMIIGFLSVRRMIVPWNTVWIPASVFEMVGYADLMEIFRVCHVWIL